MLKLPSIFMSELAFSLRLKVKVEIGVDFEVEVCAFYVLSDDNARRSTRLFSAPGTRIYKHKISQCFNDI